MYGKELGANYKVFAITIFTAIVPAAWDETHPEFSFYPCEHIFANGARTHL